MIGEFLIILLLILLNGLLSLSEIAIISAKKSRLEQKAKKGNPGAKMALDLANNPSRFLSTVQIGITLVGILTGFFSGASFATYIEEHLKVFATENTQYSNLTNYAHSISIVIVEKIGNVETGIICYFPVSLDEADLQIDIPFYLVVEFNY
jgi:putative hemolysin